MDTELATWRCRQQWWYHNGDQTNRHWKQGGSNPHILQISDLQAFQPLDRAILSGCPRNCTFQSLQSNQIVIFAKHNSWNGFTELKRGWIDWLDSLYVTTHRITYPKPATTLSDFRANQVLGSSSLGFAESPQGLRMNCILNGTWPGYSLTASTLQISGEKASW